MNPTHRLVRGARRALGVGAVLLALHAPAAHALRVATWNLLAYDDAALAR